MLGRHSSIVIPRDTPYAEEMRKHEAFPTEFGPGLRPYVFREYPKRIYKAVRQEQGGVGFEGHTVNNETELRNMQSRGFCETQQGALDLMAREQTEHGKLAAERNWEAKAGRISEKATAEMRAAEEAHGARHLPEVPHTPIKRGGRPKGSKNKPKETVHP